ncbi:MAG TPA: glycerophosphodiester phosphodiesterase family protein [Microvirga sp.]|jgi:glycerophosphoryl diester phosphodiesterase
MSAPAWLTAQPIAHRGLHDKANGIVENTLSAADAAVARGFAIECDVQLSADGEAMVFHDFTLERLTAETGRVIDRKAVDLARIGIAGSAADRIPTLDDLLGRIAGRVPLVCEIKSAFDGDMRLTERTCAVLAGYQGPVVVKSFDPRIVAHVRAVAPDLVRGIVAEANHTDKSYDRLSADEKRELGQLLHFERSQPQFISWRVGDLPAAPPYLARLLGHCPVMTWTVRTPEQRAVAERHADQMVFEGFLP